MEQSGKGGQATAAGLFTLLLEKARRRTAEGPISPGPDGGDCLGSGERGDKSVVWNLVPFSLTEGLEMSRMTC